MTTIFYIMVIVFRKNLKMYYPTTAHVCKKFTGVRMSTFDFQSETFVDRSNIILHVYCAVIYKRTVNGI